MQIAISKCAWAAVAVSMTLLVGCGTATYEERLRASAEFYSYMETMEQNLASPIWERPDKGLKLRLPLPFSATMARPEVLTDDEGNQYYGPDPRQPEFLGLELPGIVEAWQAQLAGETGELEDARIYLLTNQDRFILVDGALAEDPLTYLQDLESLLGSTFNINIPPGEIAPRPMENMPYEITVPSPGSTNAKFITPKKYKVIEFVPSEPINERAIQAVLYQHNAADIQVAILIIGPKSFSSQFRQRVDMALQTLQATPQMASQIDPNTGGSTNQGGSVGF